ncbi:MAG: hypothetical protein J6K25_08020 [Thermoguttaceae bacterium]|nr:hypothetical protein [Thermoguttaceae bacterium]
MNEKVKFKRFTSLPDAFDYLKAASPERVFLEIDAIIEYRGASGPFKGRFVGFYEDGNYNLERCETKRSGVKEILRSLFSFGRGGKR